jgi:hypothetical protein
LQALVLRERPSVSLTEQLLAITQHPTTAITKTVQHQQPKHLHRLLPQAMQNRRRLAVTIHLHATLQPFATARAAAATPWRTAVAATTAAMADADPQVFSAVFSAVNAAWANHSSWFQMGFAESTWVDGPALATMTDPIPVASTITTDEFSSDSSGCTLRRLPMEAKV